MPERAGIERRSFPFSARRWQCVLALALAIATAAACTTVPKVVRVKVSPEDVLRANEVAREADACFARRDFYAALIKYLEAGRLNPNSEFIQNKLGITYSQLKFYGEAEAAFKRAIGLAPKYPFAFNNLGTVFFAQGDKKSAERYFKKAISINPQVASFHVNLGSLYFERKKFDKGMEEWRKGLALDPGVLSKSDGVNLAAPGDKDRAAERTFFMARLYASFGNAEKAVESLQTALNAGFTDIAAIRAEKDFDPIRQDERFVTFMKTATLLAR